MLWVSAKSQADKRSVKVDVPLCEREGQNMHYFRENRPSFPKNAHYTS